MRPRSIEEIVGRLPASAGTVLGVLELDGAALVGFSMGGGEVARYVGRHGVKRVSKVVLVGAVPPTMMKS